MTPRRAAAATSAVAACALWSGPAAAHAPVAGIGAFWNGVLHPLLVPTHTLALIAVGLILGQHAPRLSRMGWPLFAATLAAAVLAAGALPVSPIALVVISCLGGLLVALDRPLTTPTLALSAGAAAAIGLDSVPDAADALPAQLGTVVGCLLCVTLVGGAVAALREPWQRIGVRIAGSWLAAATMLVAALGLRA